MELDLQKISGNKAPFPGTASGRYDVDLHDLFTEQLGGTVGMNFDRSILDRSRIDAGTARVGIANGVARLLDPLQATGPGWSLAALGGIGIRSGGVDSLHLMFETDALSPWRPVSHVVHSVERSGFPDGRAATIAWTWSPVGGWIHSRSTAGRYGLVASASAATVRLDCWSTRPALRSLWRTCWKRRTAASRSGPIRFAPGRSI